MEQQQGEEEPTEVVRSHAWVAEYTISIVVPGEESPHLPGDHHLQSLVRNFLRRQWDLTGPIAVVVSLDTLMPVERRHVMTIPKGGANGHDATRAAFADNGD